jgi:hypothetical protein
VEVSKSEEKRIAAQKEGVMSDLNQKIEQTQAAIRGAILKGDSTQSLRSYLAELQAKAAKLQAQEQAKQAAQNAAQRVELDRVAADAVVLAEARQARLSSLSDRFRIPDRRSSFA